MRVGATGSNADFPAMLINDALTHPQSQPCTRELLCCVKGLKEMLQDMRANAFAGIGDRDPNAVAVLGVASRSGPHNQATSAVRSVDGIANQIVNHLSNFTLYAEHRRRWCDLFLDSDATHE